MTENYTPGCPCCDPDAAPTIQFVAAVPSEGADRMEGTAPARDQLLGRRVLLRSAGALGVGAAAGAATGLLGAPQPAAAHGTTHVESAVATAPAVHGRNTAVGGLAILGDVPGNGRGVMGVAPGSGNGVFGLQGAETEAGAGYSGLTGIAVQGMGCCGVAGTKPTWSTTVGAAVFGRAIM